MKSLYVLRTPNRSAISGRHELDVSLEPLPAALAPEYRLLVAVERTVGIEVIESVGPHDTGLQPIRHPQNARALLGPQPRRQTGGRVVRLLHGLVRRPEGH